MSRDDIINEYFEWMLNLMCSGKFAKEISYRKLFIVLHQTPFEYLLSTDSDRAEDGIGLRWKFTCRTGQQNYFTEIKEALEGPCSVLEMMIALAIRCEGTIMDSTLFGDRTRQWFWGMISSLGLSNQMDDRFDKDYVIYILDTFLKRKYQPNGKGGLFTIKNTNYDLRNVDIWRQLCWYLDAFT